MPKLRVRGITIEINADMTGFVKNFKKSEKQIKDLKTELRDVDKLIKRDDFWMFKKNKTEVVDLLRQKQKYLAQDIQATKDRIKEEERALQELGEADPTPETIKLQETLQRELYNDKLALEELEKQQKDFGSVSKQEWLGVAQGIEAFGDKMIDFGKKITDVGTKLTTRVSVPLVGLGTSMANSAMDFETAMAKVKAVAQDVSETDMARLEEAALQMSTSTKFSATETAQALYYMGLAGWDASEMLEALPDVLNLAAAGDLELGRASDIVTDFVTAFGLEAKDATHFVDVMAQTMANSNTDVNQLGEAFKYVAPVAGALGYSIEDVSLALGIMANNGIKGSQAGTSLRQLMQRLAKPTAEVAGAMEALGISLEDQNGRAYSFKEIIDQIRKSLNFTGMSTEELTRQVSLLEDAFENGELTEEEYDKAMQDLVGSAMGVTGAEKAKNAAILAGTRGMSGLLGIINSTSEDYDGLAETINGANGAAQDIADVMLSTTEGSMLKLKRSVEELSISFGKLMVPYINAGVNALKDAVKWLKGTDDKTKDLIIRVGAFAVALGPAITALGALITSGGTIVKLVGGVIGLLAAHPVAAAVIGLTAAIGGLSAILIRSSEEMKKAAEAEYGLGEAEQVLIDKINARKEALDNIKDARDENLEATETELTKYESLVSMLDSIVDENGTIMDGYHARADYITNELSEALGIEIEINDGIVSKYQEIRQAIDDVIASKRREAIINSYQAEYEEAVAGVTEAQKELVLQQDAVAQAEQRAKEAHEDLQEVLDKIVTDDDVSKYASQLYTLGNAASVADDALNDSKEALATAEETYGSYMTTITNYEGVLSAVANGDINALNNAITRLTAGFKTAKFATREELQQQLQDFQNQYGAMKRAVEQGMPGVTQEQVNQMHALVVAAQNELDSGMGGFRERGKQMGTELADGLGASESKVKVPAQSLKEAILKGLSADTYSSGVNFVRGFIEGLNDSEHLAANAATRIATKSKSSFNAVLGVNSPAKELIKSGRYFDQGFAIGIEDEAQRAIDAARALANSTMGVMNTAPGFSPSASAMTNNTYGAINVTINAANVQNDAELADMVADRINREVLRRQAVYA